MSRFFIDSADVSVLKQLLPTGLVDGVTTNPSSLAKQGDNRTTVIQSLLIC